MSKLFPSKFVIETQVVGVAIFLAEVRQGIVADDKSNEKFYSYDIVDDSYECRSKLFIKNKWIIKHSHLIQ